MTAASREDTLPDATRIGRSALRVSAMEDVVDFYRDVVGLRVLHQKASTAVLGVDETPLLVLEGDEEAPPRPRSATGLFHNAFRVPTRGALGDALRRIRTHWQLDGASDHRVSEALYLTDPEGNGVEIYRDFPRDQWPVAADGSVQITTEPIDLESVEEAAAGGESAPSGTEIGHVHLEVSSLEAFDIFYVDTLGFEVQTAIPQASFVSAGGYHHHLGANTWNHRTTPASGRGLSWFEILLPDQRGLDAVEERLRNSGVAVTSTNDGIAVSDSDDIEVRLRVENQD